MKKILSTLLVLAILSSLITMPVMASELESYVEPYYYYNFDFSDETIPTGLTVTNSKIEDGHLVVQTDGVSEKQTEKLVLATIKNTKEIKQDLVLEFRARFDMKANTSYFASRYNANGYSHALFMAGASYGASEGIKWINGDSSADTCIAKLGPLTEYHTVSVVYKANEPANRHLYVDGIYYGDLYDYSTETPTLRTTEKTDYANLWAKSGSTAFDLRLYSRYGTDKIYLDYLKVYESPSHFIAEIENSEDVSTGEITVKFNNTVGSETISADKFSVSDGTKETKISQIKRIDEKTYILVPETLLEKSKTYTLNIRKIKDNLANEIYTDSISFKTSTDTYSDAQTYFYNDYSDGYEFYDVSTAGDELTYGLAQTEDGKSVFKVQGTDIYHNAGNPYFKFPLIKPDPAAAPNELVLEYKIKLDTDTGYLGAWTSTSTTEDKMYRAKNVGLGRQGLKDKVLFHYTDTSPIKDDFTIDTTEWNTITIVYPKNVKTRDVYVNGTYLGTSPEGDAENVYASKGGLMFAPLPDFSSTRDMFMLDYVKITDMSACFDAKITNADINRITVEFNATPAGISESIFTLSDGTAIKEVKEISERSFVLIPENNLESGMEYTLNINGIKDTLAREINTNSLTFETPASSKYEGGYVYHNFDFEDNQVPAGITAGNDTTVIEASDGILKFSTSSKTIAGYASIAQSTNPNYDGTKESYTKDIPDLVLEYKVKLINSNKSNYLSFRNSKNYENDIVFMGAESYGIPNGIAWIQPSPIVAQDIGDISEWHTIAVVYNGSDITRRLFVDGVDYGSSPADIATANTWKTHGRAVFTYKLWTPVNLSDNAQFEYIKVYTPDDKFTASVSYISDDLKSIRLDFSNSVGIINADMIKIGERFAESVELYDEKEQIYTVNLSEKLRAGTEYDVVLSGVTSTLAKVMSDVVTFETPEATDKNIVVNAVNPENGKIVINDVEGLSATAKEDSVVILKAQPNLGYEAIVKIGDEVLAADRFDNYRFVIEENTEVSVSFVPSSESIEIETIRKGLVDKISAMAVGVLRVPSEDYGMYITSEDMFVAEKKSNLYPDNAVIEAKIEAAMADESKMVYKLKADGTNQFGEFGIKVVDLNKKLGKKFYMIPYAVYNGKTIFGYSVTVVR